MPRLHTVFDTNVYIALTSDYLREVSNREKDCGVQSFASIWPCLELLAHCAASSDPQYQRSHSILRKIGGHAGYEGLEGLRIRMHEAGDNTLAMGLFGQRMEEHLLEHGFAAGLIREVMMKQAAIFAAENSEALKAVATRVLSEEAHFARSLAELVELANTHGRAEFRETIQSAEGLKLIAETKVKSLASRLGLYLEEHDLRAAAERVVNNFPIPIYFLRDLLIDLLNSDMNLAKPRNRNSVWDLKLAFHASKGAAIGGVPILLVSDDPRIQRAATSASQQQRVASLADYNKLLSDPVAIADRVHALRHAA